MSRAEDCVARCKCPMCKAPRGEMCRYVPISPNPVYGHKQQTRAALTGTVCKKPHTDRFTALRMLEIKEWRQEAANRWAKAVQEDRTVGAARRGYADGVKRETAQLVEWLRRWGPILWT